MLNHKDIGIAIVIFFLLFLVPASPAQALIWKPKAELPEPLRGTAIATHDGIYFMEANPRGSDVYEYDPIADSWTKISQMITWGWNVNL